MRSFLRFNRGVLALPLHLQLWVVSLVAANLVAPFFFLEHLEARVTLAVGYFGLALMGALTGRYGFSRIVGIGHIGWVPLLVFLVGSLGESAAATPFGLWLRIVIAVDAISLVFDTIDAARFFRGDREETVAGLEPRFEAVRSALRMSERRFFEILDSTRAIKRLKPDPVPLALVRKVLDAGTKAPSGVNTQPWEFLVVRDPETKRWIQERYLHFAKQRFSALAQSLEGTDTAHARVIRTVLHLAEHLHEAPVLLFVCGHRDWPAAVPPEERLGPAPPPYGSIYPCVQNILLACRAVGLGASLTTIHQLFEAELAKQLGVPDGVSLVALLPIGFPRGHFGAVTRKPARELTHFDHWEQRSEPSATAGRTTQPGARS